jgi:hypothetical protein
MIMDLHFLCNYIVFVVLGICLCIGYVIKYSLDFIPNKYIPLIMLVIGVIANIGLNQKVNPEIVLGGMFTGLTSTGLHEAFKNFLHKHDKK